MRTYVITVLLLLAAGLGGCIGSDPGDQDLNVTAADELTTTQAEAATNLLRMGGCIEEFSVVPIPMETAQAIVPDGFTPEAFDPLGLTALEYVVTYGCSSGNVSGEELTAVQEMTAGIIVQVPTEHEVRGYVGYGVAIGMITDNEITAETYETWGIPEVFEGELSRSVLVDAPAARSVRASGSVDGIGVTVLSNAAGPATTGEPGTFRIFLNDGEGGDLTGAIDLSWNEGQLMETGAAVLVLGGDPVVVPPVEPGLATHWWGDDYAYTFEYVPLEELTGDPGDDEPASTSVPDRLVKLPPRLG